MRQLRRVRVEQRVFPQKRRVGERERSSHPNPGAGAHPRRIVPPGRITHHEVAQRVDGSTRAGGAVARYVTPQDR